MSLSDKIQAAVATGLDVDLSRLDLGFIDLQGWIDDFEASSTDAILTINADSLSPEQIKKVSEMAGRRVRLSFTHHS
ncbi:MAG: hypothetical protein WBA35_00160 [Litorimonas sp.]